MLKHLIAISMLFSSSAFAELYFELGIEGGGETLAETDSVDEINAGSGVKLALGIQNQIGENGQYLSLALGYLFDSIDATNGTADFDTLTFDTIYNIQSGDHRFGIGASYHIGPTYKEDVDGYLPVKVDYDDALGLVLQYSYAVSNGFQIGARFTQMEYDADNINNTVDADSLGIFLSNGF